MSTPYDNSYQNTVQTTDATPTNIFSGQLPSESSAIINVLLVARRVSNDNTKGWNATAVIKRVGANASFVGTLSNVLDPIGDLGALGWYLDYAVSGDTYYIRVNGQASATIEWYGRIDSYTIQE